MTNRPIEKLNTRLITGTGVNDLEWPVTCIFSESVKKTRIKIDQLS